MVKSLRKSDVSHPTGTNDIWEEEKLFAPPPHLHWENPGCARGNGFCLTPCAYRKRTGTLKGTETIDSKRVDGYSLKAVTENKRDITSTQEPVLRRAASDPRYTAGLRIADRVSSTAPGDWHPMVTPGVRGTLGPRLAPTHPTPTRADPLWSGPETRCRNPDPDTMIEPEPWDATLRLGDMSSRLVFVHT